MRGQKLEALSLNEKERSELQSLVRRHYTQQQVALSGRIILAADAGQNNSQIAREEGVSTSTRTLKSFGGLNRPRMAL